MKPIIGAVGVSSGPLSREPGTEPVRASLLPVDEESAGQRLDNFLFRLLKGVPKTHVYRIIRSGEVRVNKGRASAQTRLSAGDSVRLPPVRQSERALHKSLAMGSAQRRDGVPSSAAGTPFEMTVLHEDELLLALDKPAGMAVHGGSGISFGLIERLRMARPQAKFLELVHRLDRETSGVLLVAKKRSALAALQQQFRERETGKIYLAAVDGSWPLRSRVIDAPLHKYLVNTDTGEERRVKVVAPDDPDGMSAVTLVKIERRLLDSTLLQVTIKTGRTHQIRVHLAHAGHPILGDDRYGDFELNRRLGRSKSGLKRMFLHAWKLQVDHPATGARLQLESPLPEELQSWLDRQTVAAAGTPA